MAKDFIRVVLQLCPKCLLNYLKAFRQSDVPRIGDGRVFSTEV